MSERSASDILLELEAKVDKMFMILSNVDLLMKTLNNRISALEKKISGNIEIKVEKSEAVSPPVESKNNFSFETTDPNVTGKTIPGLKPGVKLGNVNGKPALVKLNETENTAVTPVAQISTKSVTIQQKIVYKEDGKSICLAHVSIYKNSILQKEVKTNAAGKWSASLEPGKYIIKITKHGSNERTNIEKSFDISVPESNAPVQLDMMQC